LLLVVVTITGCASPPPAEDAPSRPTGEELARDLLIVDTHIDVPYRLEEKPADVSVATEDGDFDAPRAQRGGLDAAFMSIYIPASYQEEGGAKALADHLIDGVEAMAAGAPDVFGVAYGTDDVERLRAAGRIALPMGMENGAGIEDDLANLEYFRGRGISYITLTHSEDNLIGDSSYSDKAQRHWQGLSPFGREVVAEMNRLGIMVDISHVSDLTFDQVLDLSTAPVIASHSSCRHFTPGWERNLDDERIRRLAANGGVIQINFGSAFLRQDANEQGLAFYAAMDELKEANGLESGDPAVEAFQKEYWSGRQRIFADITDVVAHIRHVVEIAGIDAVGLGSDFDGVGDSLPTGLKDVSQYPHLIDELLAAGFSEDEIAKICGGNLMRVWRQVEAVAASAAPGTDSPDA